PCGFAWVERIKKAVPLGRTAFYGFSESSQPSSGRLDYANNHDYNNAVNNVVVLVLAHLTVFKLKKPPSTRMAFGIYIFRLPFSSVIVPRQ
ncbi:MAG: hypothetical protein AAF990_05645, partial [Bacteroidota bacterium]